MIYLCKIYWFQVLETRKWTSLQNDVDVEAILANPLINSSMEDMRIWGEASNKRFSVKYGYRVVMERLADMSNSRILFIIWHIKVPHLVRVFLWRLCRDWLPLPMRLRDKGADCPFICSRCNEGLEFCWKEVGLWHHISRTIDCFKNFREACFHLFESLESHCRSLFAMILWSLWRCQNNLI